MNKQPKLQVIENAVADNDDPNATIIRLQKKLIEFKEADNTRLKHEIKQLWLLYDELSATIVKKNELINNYFNKTHIVDSSQIIE